MINSKKNFTCFYLTKQKGEFVCNYDVCSTKEPAEVKTRMSKHLLKISRKNGKLTIIDIENYYEYIKKTENK